MADTSNLSNFLEDIADAIRLKKGASELIAAENFDTEILSIESGMDTSDATATANDILSPKTAYVNGQKIKGAIESNYILTEPEFKLLDSASPVDTTYRIRAVSYKHNVVLVDTLLGQARCNEICCCW